MKKEITVTAKTVELAVAKAVEELGAPNADAISYTVLEEAKKGFLGLGGTPAVIAATFGKDGTDIAVEFIKKILEDMQIEGEVTVSTRDDGDKLLNIEGKNVARHSFCSLLFGGCLFFSLEYFHQFSAEIIYRLQVGIFAPDTDNFALDFRVTDRSKCDLVLNHPAGIFNGEHIAVDTDDLFKKLFLFHIQVILLMEFTYYSSAKRSDPLPL